MVDIQGLDTALVAKWGRINDAMTALGHPMRICQGKRTTEEQQALYAQGRTTPGHIVTNCDGILKLSNHQSGRALDACFEGKDPFLEKSPRGEAVAIWAAYGACGEAMGLVWGGRFQLVDKPHLELKA